MSPHSGVGALVTNQARTRFFVQQKDTNYTPHPMGYSFFGGAVDAGESTDVAIVRELREELGDAAEALVVAGPTLQFVEVVGPAGFDFALYEVVLADEVLEGLANVPVHEGERGALVERAQLAQLPFIWGLEQVVARYLSGATTGSKPTLASTVGIGPVTAEAPALREFLEAFDILDIEEFTSTLTRMDRGVLMRMNPRGT
jgi:8-oxo-dGTP pyrophosphatase MutT (NUDIX family)